MELVQSRPVENVKRPKVSNKRIRYLTDAEREAARKHANSKPDLYLLVLAISTGMRKGEIMGMRWQDIHTEGDQTSPACMLTKTKNDKARSVLPLAGPWKLLALRRTQAANTASQDSAGLIFPSA
jgi:integrase